MSNFGDSVRLLSDARIDLAAIRGHNNEFTFNDA